MPPWASSLWEIDPATHTESVYDAFHGYMGQSPFIPGLARGPGSWEARSSSVGRGSGCAQAADSDIGHITSGAIPETFESMDIDKLMAAAQNPEAFAKAQEAARAVLLGWPTPAQELHSQQTALRQQGPAEPMGGKSRPIFRQQPAHQQPSMPQKRRLLEQPLEGRHRDKRQHREPRPPQAPVSGRKRLPSEEADSHLCKTARLDTEAWPRSQHGQASMPAPQTGFTMGLHSRKAEQAQPNYCDRTPRKNLKGTKQGDAVVLEEAAVQPRCAPAVSDGQHEARVPQFTWGCCNRRPRKARRSAAHVKTAWPAAATSATAAPDEELQALLDAFLMPTEPSEAVDMSAIFGSIDPAPQAPAVSNWSVLGCPVTRPLYNIVPPAPPAAPQPIGAPESDTWPEPKLPVHLKPEWRCEGPAAARFFTKMTQQDLAQLLRNLEPGSEAALKPRPPFRPRPSRLRFESRPANQSAIPVAVQ